MNIQYFKAAMQTLHEQGKIFAEAYPEHAQMLNLDEVRDRDPYVERLLEGMAFLSGQIQERIDADVPEISETFLEQLVPSLLRPFPSGTIVQYQSQDSSLIETKLIEKENILASPAMGDKKDSYQFRTTDAVSFNPIFLSNLEWDISPEGNTLFSLEFSCDESVILQNLNLNELLLYLNLEPFLKNNLVYAMTQKLKKATLHYYNVSLPFMTAMPMVQKINTSMTPSVSREFSGYQYLKEFFAFPEKSHFLTITDIPYQQIPPSIKKFSIVFESYHDNYPYNKIKKENILLHCVPAMNLFSAASEPISLDHQRIEYSVIMDSQKKIYPYCIEQVVAINPQNRQQEILGSLYDFYYRDLQKPYYQYRLKINSKDESQCWLSLGGFKQQEMNTLSVSSLCYQGEYPRQYLKMNDLTLRHSDKAITATNVIRPSRCLMPPAYKQFQWTLIQSLLANYQTLTTAKDLKKILSLFDWSDRLENKKMISSIQTLTLTTIQKVKHGAIRFGVEIKILLDDSVYGNIVDAYAFMKCLHDFFTLMAEVNSFVYTMIEFLNMHETWLMTS
jgi:type VI secretion system protein ImpG